MSRSIAPRRLLGPFQQQVLATLIRLGRDVAPSTIRIHIARRTGRWVAPQQVHTALDRLVARGCATSWRRGPARDYLPWWTRPGPRRPRAARRFASATTWGRRALRLTLWPLDQLRAGLPGLGLEDRTYQHHLPVPDWYRRPVPLRLSSP